ncbi:MAG: hypothetical protein QF879_16180 [Candidatus Latescibacteria bacterium]|nr:hypothetical protein [Candidatus Latescibacterota bacterium]MDP7236746.1 hypothetical protein [Candidatus Latescibacterota bacterium]
MCVHPLERISSLHVEHHTPKPSIETLNMFFRRKINELWTCGFAVSRSSMNE